MTNCTLSSFSLYYPSQTTHTLQHKKLLEFRYPVIYKGQQTLEICVPILSDPTNCSSSSEDAAKPGGGGIPIAVPQRFPTPTTSPNTNSLPVVGSYLSSTTDNSWEVLSRKSALAAKFAPSRDASSTHSLVPVWECVQEAMRTPVTRFCGRRIVFQEVIPDLLYADLPRQCIYRATQSQSGNLCLPDLEDQEAVTSDVSGLRLKKYYTMAEDDLYMHRSADAQRTVSPLCGWVCLCVAVFVCRCGCGWVCY